MSHQDVSRRVTDQTPFASMRSTFSAADRQSRGSTSRSYTWVGRITYSWRESDKQGRLAFLYDVEPLIGGPNPTSASLAGQSKGAKYPVVQYVRLAQPYCSSIFNQDAAATGIIIAPEVGSLVLVGEDPFGWIIIGFLTGPSTPYGNVPQLAEVTQNPGIEEVANTLYSPSFIANFADVTEGDIIIGRGKNRVRFSRDGLLVGANINSCDLFRADGRFKYSRFINLEERAPGYLGYKHVFLGLSMVPGYTLDQAITHTSIVETNPDTANLKPYVVRQVGHVSSDHIASGRYAGEIEPSPMSTTAEQTSQQYTVIRESVVQPAAPPTGTAADAQELMTTSGVVYDFQVRADGSFHIRSGKPAPPVATPGVSKYGAITDHTLDLQFDAITKTLKLRMGASGTPMVHLIADGNIGTLTIIATQSVSLQAPMVTMPQQTTFSCPAGFAFETQGLFSIKAGAISIKSDSTGSWDGGNITVPGDIKAGVISLITHTHSYITPAIPAGPGVTTPSLP